MNGLPEGITPLQTAGEARPPISAAHRLLASVTQAAACRLPRPKKEEKIR